VAVFASFAVLCLEASLMAEVPLTDSATAVMELLSSTHYGAAWCLATVALAFGIAMSVAVPRHFVRHRSIATAAALAVFWYGRGIVSHAAGSGDFSFPVAVDWVHLCLTSLWLGEVVIAGLLILRGAAPLPGEARRDRAAYVAALSNSATIALAGIFATGLLNVWYNVDSLDGLMGTAYGRMLLAKIAVVGVAVLLGAINRFLMMPSWLAIERTGSVAPPAMAQRFRRVVLVEAAVLDVALMLAVVLAATAPSR
jgi:putative copper resistance protein D